LFVSKKSPSLIAEDTPPAPIKCAEANNPGNSEGVISFIFLPCSTNFCAKAL
jgi:hypothetical protein